MAGEQPQDINEPIGYLGKLDQEASMVHEQGGAVFGVDGISQDIRGGFGWKSL